MTPRFNLLAGRFEAVGVTFAFGSTWIQGGRTWLGLTVRQGQKSYVELRRVKGFEPVVYN